MRSIKNSKALFVAITFVMSLAASGCALSSSSAVKLTGEVVNSVEVTIAKPTVRETVEPTEKPTEKSTEKPTEKQTEEPETLAPETTITETTEAPTTVPETTTEAPTTTAEPTTEAPKDTYEHNQYYDIVEEQQYTSSIGYTIIIHKLLAKQSVRIDSTVIAYAPDGNVIGKSSDDITISAGKYNYFRYSFDQDVSAATFQINAKSKAISSYMTGDLDAVEMVNYNLAGTDLYITFKQVKENLGSFAKFKLLFYKGDVLVNDEDGYFSVYAENLDGVGTQDVASIWAYKLDFDRVEYMFEP